MAREDWVRHAPVLQLREDEAREFLAPALGKVSIVGLEPLGGGHANTNICVRLKEPPYAVVIRLYQRDPGEMRKEAAIARLIAGRVPAPAYLFCGMRPDRQAYAVVEFLGGGPLQARVAEAGLNEHSFIACQIGAALAAIHSFTFPQAGFLDGDLNVTPFPDAVVSSDYLETTFRGVAGERLGRALVAEVVVFAKANDQRLAAWAEPPRLTHFDFGSSNILVREDFSLSGIVDWEFAAAAFPAADFGNLLRPPLGLSDAFVSGVEQGYRDAGGFLPHDWLALARLADIGAWADFLARDHASDQLIADARDILTRTVAEAQATKVSSSA